MRRKWTYIRPIGVCLVLLMVMYGVFYHRTTTSRSVSQEIVKHVETFEKDVSKLALTAARFVLAEDSHVVFDDVAKEGDSEPDGNFFWVVPAAKQAWKLGLLLHSLKGYRNVMVSVQTNALMSVAENHGSIVVPYKRQCPKAARPEKVGDQIDECYKNHWFWAVREAIEDHNPEAICVTEDDVVIHPGARKWLQTQSFRSGGVRLASSQNAPWCFRRDTWAALDGASNTLCSSKYNSWSASVADLLAKSNSSLATYVHPSEDMAMKVSDCDESNSEPSQCADVTLKSIQTWTSSQRAETQARKSAWTPPPAEQRREKSMTDYAHCKGLCEGFIFTATDDKRVHTQEFEFKGKAYMIDLGRACIDSSKVKISRGGEEIKEVLGRQEGDEFARYGPGAWTILGSVPQIRTDLYQKGVLDSAVVVDEIPHVDVPGTTIAFERIDYANVWQNTADLFNFHLTLEHTAADNLIWLDGHSVGNLDDMWKTPFGLNVQQLGHLSGKTCYERVVLMPKKSPIYGIDRFGGCSVDGFVKRVLSAYNITPAEEKHDTVIIRSYYLAHPRQKGSADRTFSEEQLNKLRKRLPGAKFVRFHELSLKEQLQTIANTKTLYGIHGAGCTYGLYLSPGSKLVEWVVPSRVSVKTFQYMMSWRPDLYFERLTLDAWFNRYGEQPE